MITPARQEMVFHCRKQQRSLWVELMSGVWPKHLERRCKDVVTSEVRHRLTSGRVKLSWKEWDLCLKMPVAQHHLLLFSDSVSVSCVSRILIIGVSIICRYIFMCIFNHWKNYSAKTTCNLYWEKHE